MTAGDEPNRRHYDYGDEWTKLEMSPTVDKVSPKISGGCLPPRITVDIMTTEGFGKRRKNLYTPAEKISGVEQKTGVLVAERYRFFSNVC